MIVSQYQTEFTNRAAQGWRLTWVSGYDLGNAPHFAAVWEKSTGPLQFVRHGMTGAEYQAEFLNRKTLGYRLALVNGYAVNNVAYYVAIWQKTTGATLFAKHGMTSTQYQAEYTNRTNLGYRIVHISGYTVDNVPYYAAIWVQQTGPVLIARHGMSAATYQSEFNTNAINGYRLSLVSGYTINGEAHYAAIWEKLTGLPPWEASHGHDSPGYQQVYLDYVRQGFRPIVVSGFSVAEQDHYVSIWENNYYSATDLSKINTPVKNVLAATGAPAISLAVTKGGRLVFAKAYGLADRASNTKAHSESRFRIMSVSKSLTGAAVLWLTNFKQSDGTPFLNLTDKVFAPGGILADDFNLTGVRSEIKEITVQHLLNHTSGAWGGGGSACPDPMFSNNSLDQNTLIQNTLTNCPPDRDASGNFLRPGVRYNYSNFGYCLLGRILEKRSPPPPFEYVDFVNWSVLANSPVSLELAGSTFADRKFNEVTYYDGTPYAFNVPRMDAHGGWLATPIDLVRFAVRVDGFSSPPDVFPISIWSKMVKPSGVGGSTYACGWVNDGTTPNVIWHNGSLDGTSSVLIQTTDGYTLSAIANTRRNFASDTLKKLMLDIKNAGVNWPAAANFF
jgi:hypothetical protein